MSLIEAEESMLDNVFTIIPRSCFWRSNLEIFGGLSAFLKKTTLDFLSSAAVAGRGFDGAFLRSDCDWT